MLEAHAVRYLGRRGERLLLLDAREEGLGRVVQVVVVGVHRHAMADEGTRSFADPVLLVDLVHGDGRGLRMRRWKVGMLLLLSDGLKEVLPAHLLHHREKGRSVGVLRRARQPIHPLVSSTIHHGGHTLPF